MREIRASASNFQVLAAEAFSGASPAASLVPAAESDANTMDKSYDACNASFAAQGDANLAPGLTRQMAAYIAAQDSLGAFLAGETQTAQTAQLAAAEEEAYTSLDATLAAAQDDHHRPSDHYGRSGPRGRQPRPGRSPVVHRHRRGHRRHRDRGPHPARAAGGARTGEREAVQSDLARRIAFEASLQSALEMSRAEASVFDLVAEALSQAAPGMRSELLLADSSKAHFRQVLVSSSQADDAGCGVVSPDDCPAASRARTMVFPDSTALDACPHLRGRHCSALCVPMSISGNSVGVFHVTRRTARLRQKQWRRTSRWSPEGHPSVWRCCAPSRSPRHRPTATRSRAS